MGPCVIGPENFDPDVFDLFIRFGNDTLDVDHGWTQGNGTNRHNSGVAGLVVTENPLTGQTGWSCPPLLNLF